MLFNSPTELRTAFARRLSALYGGEVPAYNTLVEVSHEVNSLVAEKMGAAAERLGSISRVTAERHGAIRVGTREELAQVSRVFGAMGMFPVGFYDLRDTASPVPVVSTAFRPIDRQELERVSSVAADIGGITTTHVNHLTPGCSTLTSYMCAWKPVVLR